MKIRVTNKTFQSLITMIKIAKKKKKRFATFPLVGIPAGLTIYLTMFHNNGPTWFSLHPISMISTLVAFSAAVLSQKWEGTESEKKQRRLLFLSSSLVMFGSYVVWAIKEMFGKPHFVTIHSHLGLMTEFAILIYVTASAMEFNPNKPQANKWKQLLYKYSGQGILALGLFTIAVGVLELERYPWNTIAWIASLGFFGPSSF